MKELIIRKNDNELFVWNRDLMRYKGYILINGERHDILNTVSGDFEMNQMQFDQFVFTIFDENGGIYDENIRIAREECQKAVADRVNHSNQLNPNHSAYHSSRGYI